MKYSSSIRMINAVVFALIFVAFGCLGFYFSFFVCPDFFVPSGSSQANNFIGNTGYNFPLQFGVLGLAVMLIAALGFALSLKSIRHENDDKIVRASFLCYVAIGYVFCVFFFLNSVLLYRLIGKDQIAWWIVVSTILLIAALIASNVPMMKMLEDADSNIILTVLTATFAIILFSLGLTLGITYLITLGASTNVGVIRAELLTYVLITLAAFLLSLFAAIVFFKNYKKGAQTKLPHLLADIGMIVVSGLFFGSSSFEYVYRKTSSASYYNSLQGTNRAYAGLDYVVMGYIVGSLLVIGAVVLLISNLIGDKKPAPKKAA
jgi:hypothetical protein